MAPPSDSNPAAAHQTKFRVVPKKSYSERMSETRAEIRRIMKEALRTRLSYDYMLHWLMLLQGA